LWKRATPAGGFWGLLVGTASSIAMFVYTSTGTAAHKANALAHIALSRDAQPMAENLYRAGWSWLICAAVTVAISYATKPLAEEKLVGLVYGSTIIPDDGSAKLYQKPIFWAIIVATGLFFLNIWLW